MMMVMLHWRCGCEFVKLRERPTQGFLSDGFWSTFDVLAGKMVKQAYRFCVVLLLLRGKFIGLLIVCCDGCVSGLGWGIYNGL